MRLSWSTFFGALCVRVSKQDITLAKADGPLVLHSILERVKSSAGTFDVTNQGNGLLNPQ